MAPMTVTVTIHTGNDAFGNEPEAEVSRILRELAGKVQVYALEPGDVEPLLDANGNTVGVMLVGRRA